MSVQLLDSFWGPSWGPFICKIMLDRQKGPQKDPKKNHHIQEMCALGDFEIHRKRCVGILSRRRHQAQVGESSEETACGTFAGMGHRRLWIVVDFCNGIRRQLIDVIVRGA